MSGCRNEGLENSPGFQFTIKTEFIADELAESVGFKTSGECPDEAGQGLQQGGLAPPIAGEKIMGAVVEGDVLGHLGQKGVVADGQAPGELDRCFGRFSGGGSHLELWAMPGG